MSPGERYCWRRATTSALLGPSYSAGLWLHWGSEIVRVGLFRVVDIEGSGQSVWNRQDAKDAKKTIHHREHRAHREKSEKKRRVFTAEDAEIAERPEWEITFLRSLRPLRTLQFNLCSSRSFLCVFCAL